MPKKEWAYLIGFFFGDGSFCIDKKSRHYKVSFSLNPQKDDEIREVISGILLKLGTNPFEVFNNGSLDIRVNSKALVELIDSELNGISGKLANEEYLLGFVSGLIDSDGWIGKGEILVANTDSGMLKLVGESLAKIGIKTRLFSVPQKLTGGIIFRLRISPKLKSRRHICSKVMRGAVAGRQKAPSIASA